MDSKWDWPLIAIVDDDEFVCRAIKRLLFQHGMDSSIFSSGRTFVDLLDTNPTFVPDCVILDVRMPDLNGLEVQKLLASKRSGIPVIFITAEENPHQIAQALVAGAEAVFPKPFDGDLVISTLREVLENRPKRKQ
jgi:FixJ family two-component response regulator